MTPAVAAFMWRSILHPDLGIMNYFVLMLGFGKTVWLGDPNLALFSLILSGPESRTLPVMVSGFETDRGIRWGQLSSAAVSIMLPVIAVALFLQRHIVKGLTTGAVKG